MLFRLSCALALLALGLLPARAETSVAITPLRLAPLPLGVVTFANGKAMNLTVGIGSGAFHHASDAPGRIWTVTDRGPAIGCADAPVLIGIDPATLCGGDLDARILPLPGFTPTIYGLDIGPDRIARVSVTLPLKGRSGRPVTGIANPLPEAQKAFDATGKPLPFNPSGLDTEAIVKLSDGSFWLADEYGPSLVHVDADGTVLRRLVPHGAGAELAGADYEVIEALPAILARHAAGRGFEGLAISPDETTIYVAMQGPLTVPGNGLPASPDLRLFRIARETGQVLDEYLYRLDPPSEFPQDERKQPRSQRDVRVSEIVAVGPDRLLVLERIEKGSRLYRIDLSQAHALPQRFDDPSLSPALEQRSPDTLAADGAVPADKTLLLDSASLLGLPGHLEGLALMSDHEIVAFSDNDFSVTGAETRIARLTFSDNILR